MNFISNHMTPIILDAGLLKKVPNCEINIKARKTNSAGFQSLNFSSSTVPYNICYNLARCAL